jgi:hypothetical protein
MMEYLWQRMMTPTGIADLASTWGMIVFFIMLFICFRELRMLAWKAFVFASAGTALIYIVRIVQ